MASDTWNLSITTFVMVQQDLVVYLEYYRINEIQHNIPHAIYGQYVCFNNCLLQDCKCVTLCHLETFIIEYQICTFDQ